ncbi:MAG TPA: hypothetical protein VGE10_00370 [Zeimonas sp.]
MSSALHAVARLIDCPTDRAGLAAELSETLAGETRLPMAMRLRLVALAARLEAGGQCECRAQAGESPEWIESLAGALLRDEASVLEALVAHAPRLRAAAARSASSACGLPAAALLELLERRLH